MKQILVNFLLIKLFCFSLIFPETVDPLHIKVKADSLFNIADSLRDNKERYQAISYFEKAITLYNEIGYFESEAYLWREMGSIYFSLKNYDTTIECYKNSMKIINGLGKDKQFESNLLKPYKLLHLVKKNENLWKIAKKYGISIQEIISENTFKDSNKIDIGDKINIHITDKYLIRKNFLGDCYNRIGFNYKELLDFDNAIIYFDSSLVIRKELNDNLWYGMVLNNIGTVYHYTANYEKAIGYYNRSLHIRSKLGDLSGSAKLHTNIGNILGKLTIYDSALFHLEKALLIRERLNNNDELGFTLLHIGIIYMHLEDYDEAENILQRARSIFQETQNEKLIGISSVNLGFFYYDKGDYIKAREYLNEGLKISRELDIKKTTAVALRGIGFVFLEQGTKFIPVEYFEKAIEISTKIGAKDEEVFCKYGLGKYYFNNKDYKSAIKHLTSAIDLSEQISKILFAEAYKIGYTKNIFPIYKMIISAFVKIGRNDKALNYVEKMKARVLLDILEGGHIGEEEILNENEIYEERELVSQLEKLNQAVLVEDKDNSLDSLYRLLDKKREELSDFNRKLYYRHPELKDFRGRGEPITMHKAKRVLSKDEAAVYFIIMDNELTTFVLSRKGLEVISQNINKEDLHVLVKRILLATKTQQFNPDYWDTSASHNLYKLLISPIEPFLLGKNRICIIPDDYLNQLPLHALQDKNTGRYLIEDYVIYYVPSLSTLSWLRMQGTSGNRDLLAFGNPEFGELDTMTFAFRGKLQKLPATENEVRTLETIYKPEVKIFTGVEASEANFKKYAEDYGVLHFATHALANKNSPMYSSICLAEGGNEDGLLEAREIMKMELSSDLVVLSACKTAYSRIMAGEGMLGLTRAFFTAGVPSVVASLWSVEDNSTSELMVNFHKRIRNGRMPTNALREAQLYLLRETEFNNPFFWAPFILIGES